MIRAPVQIAGLCLMLAAGAADAAVDHADRDTYDLPEDQTLTEELWLSADQTTLAGTATDDVSLYAGTIDLSGTFHGDVHALATEQLTFSGIASNQLRFLGRRVQLDGHAHKSLVAVAATISMSPGARIDDAAVLIGDTVITEGRQQGPLWIIANKATIQGELHGNLRILADDIVIQPGTVIHGDVTYSSTHELTPGSRVTIDGEVKRKVVAGPGLTYGGYLAIQLTLFTSTLLIGLPLIRFFPRTIGLSAGMIREATGRCILTGLVAVWVLPMLAVAFLVIPFTLPLGLALLCGLGFFGFLAQVVIALVIGSLVWKPRSPPSFIRVSLSYLAGLVVLYILTSTPILNVMVWMVTLTLGMGGLIMGHLGTQQPIGIPHAPNGTEDPPDGPPPVPPDDSPTHLTQPKE